MSGSRTEGMLSGSSPGRGSVIRYWCSSAQAGTATPTISPMWRPHMPAQLTTVSQPTVPFSVTTSVMRRSVTVMPVTRTPCSMTAPCRRAPAASAWVRLAGSAVPSEGT